MDIGLLCRYALQQRASDIHLKVGAPPLLRIHGSLRAVPDSPPLTNEELGRAVWDMMSPVQRERFKTTSDCDFAHTVAGAGRFRANVFRQQGRIGVVLRAIPTQVLSLDELSAPPVLKKVAMEPRGLVLVTGATGSGKSTTIAGILEEINRTLPHHILTIEDPVEFIFQDRRCLVNQREVGVDSATFHQALRAALRQDPDVIMVGELRDLETVEIALAAAETGHLVLATLHTIDAHEAINRILGFFEPHHQPHVRLALGSVLRAVISQRLIPGRSGGRVAAMEIMLNTSAVYECLVNPDRTREVRDLIRGGRVQYGMQTFDQAIYDLIEQGRVSPEDGMRAAHNPDELALRLAGISDED